MKHKLKRLIAAGKTKQAIQALLAISKKLNDEHFSQEVIMQSSRFEKHSKANRMGTSSNEEEGISSAKINQALLGVIERIPDNTAATSLVKEAILFRRKWVVFLGLLMAISVAIVSFMREDSFTLTVLVHGKEGKDDRILKNQGKVVLDIGTARLEAAINEKGEATFKELPAGFVGKKSFISIEHPQPYLPISRDVEYVLKRGQSIYLAVELKGINKVQGRVLDFETELPLDSVRISYQNTATLSDEFGWFELDIPTEKQAKFIRVHFFKEGYKLEDMDSIAPHVKQEIGIMLQKQ